MWLKPFLSQPGRTFRIATVISTALLAGTLFLFVATNFLNPWDHYLTLGPSFHVGVWKGGDGSAIVFFNDAEHGPYRGSITGLVGYVDPTLVHKSGFGLSYGIYYRYFQWTHATLWTLMVSLWYPLVAFSILPAAWYYRFARRKRTQDGQ